MKWHVHLDRDENEFNKDDGDHRYSLTLNPKHEGWCTDSGYQGYGLPRELAQWICDIVNEHGKDCPYEMYGGWWSKKDA